MRLTAPPAFIGLSLLALAACGSSPEAGQRQANETLHQAGEAMPSGNAEAPTPAPAPAAVQTPAADDAAATAAAGPLACAADIGAAAARRLANTCRSVSPATHPPCNVANSCAMMEEEIARSCALFDGKGAPLDECRPAPRSREAAAAVVKRYYTALNARDYDTAWRQWGEGGPRGQTPERFRAGFAHTRSTRVTVGALTPGDSGAGSTYQTVPVTVEATLDDGTRQRFGGSYIVRRVNDVDGASSAQLRWHIDSARLTPRPAG